MMLAREWDRVREKVRWEHGLDPNIYNLAELNDWTRTGRLPKSLDI